jgi:cytochrome P450
MTTTADTQALLMQLLDPSNRADPYPACEQIRARGPLRLPEAHLTVFSSFADCDDVLRHPASASDRMKSTLAQRAVANGEEERPQGPPGFLFLDPPDHPLPVAVICRLLGVPLEDEPKFSHASALLAQALDPFITIAGNVPDGSDERMTAALAGRRRAGLPAESLDPFRHR